MFPSAIDMPEVAAVAQAMKDHWAMAERSDAVAFMRGFFRALGEGAPSTLSPAEKKAVPNLMTGSAVARRNILLERFIQGGISR
jgi:hypothetical protein